MVVCQFLENAVSLAVLLWPHTSPEGMYWLVREGWREQW